MKNLLIFFAVCATSVQVCSASLIDGIKPHPRLFTDEAGFQRLKSDIVKDEVLAGCAQGVKKAANKCLGEKLPVRRITDGRRMLSISRNVLNSVTALSMAYRLFGDKRYLEKAEAVMCAAAGFSDWNPSHFLDTAEMAFALALGYDWLYSDLSQEAKTQIRDAIVKKGLDASIAKPGPRRGLNNWGQVCSGGIAAAALAVAEDEPQKCEMLLKDIKKCMPKTMQMYLPNGSYPEGPSYWTYGTCYNVILIAVLESALGTDFGFASMPAFKMTGSYPDLLTGPTGEFYNYSDSGSLRKPSWLVWWFAQRFKTPGIVEPFEREALKKFIAERKAHTVSPMLLLYYFPKKEGVTVELPLSWRADGKTDLAIQRSSWAPDGRFAAFKGGKAVGPHGHMDGGSFIYEAKGVRWAYDIGSEEYAKAEHAIGMNFWSYTEGSPRYKVFRLSANAHNTLVLDGSAHCATGEVRVVSLTEGPLSQSVIDLSKLYTNATKVIRKGLMLNDGFRIVDRVEGLRAGAPIRWTMYTKAKVEIAGDKLVLTDKGQMLEMTKDAPKGSSDWIVGKPPKGDDWESPNDSFTRIMFTVPSDPGGTDFSVTLK
ncbi:MAG: heparinase II/III family protein [Kiritimatiellae bacterium]|nr:heparinase II/III family protein [Kiritimatiellia bacterium]